MNTHLNDLLGCKKKKTRHPFRWKVVEAYRAERVQVSELEETLGIPMRELRRLNRNCLRLRLLPRAAAALYTPKPLKNHETRCGLYQNVGT